MRTVAVLIMESDEALVALARALSELTGEPGERVALVAIHDPEGEQALATRLGARNFVGHKLSDQVAAAVGESARERQGELLREAEERVRAEGVGVVSVERTGPFVETLRAVCVELAPQRIYMAKTHVGLLARFFRGGESVVPEVPCPVVEVEGRRR